MLLGSTRVDLSIRDLDLTLVDLESGFKIMIIITFILALILLICNYLESSFKTMIKIIFILILTRLNTSQPEP